MFFFSFPKCCSVFQNRENRLSNGLYSDLLEQVHINIINLLFISIIYVKMFKISETGFRKVKVMVAKNKIYRLVVSLRQNTFVSKEDEFLVYIDF